MLYQYMLKYLEVLKHELHIEEHPVHPDYQRMLKETRMFRFLINWRLFRKNTHLPAQTFGLL